VGIRADERTGRGALSTLHPPPAADGPYIIVVDGAPAGYIQTFRIADWPAYWPSRKPYISEPSAAGIDLLIGDKELTGRRLGTRVIQQFVREIVFIPPDVRACYADPAARNLASLGAFRKAGFADVGAIHAPGDATPRRLLRLARDPRCPGHDAAHREESYR